MAEKFEVKFQKELEQMEQFAKKNFAEATENLKRAEEKREDLRLEVEEWRSELNSLSKKFFKVAKEIAIMAIKPPRLSQTVKQAIQPVLDYLDCLDGFYKAHKQYTAAKGDAAEAKGKLETAQRDLEKVTAMRKKG